MLSNVVYNFGSIIVISLAGYIYWIIGGKFLLPGQYGVVSLIIAVFGFLLPIATWGLGIAVRRFIPISQSKGRTHDIRDIILFSLKITIILSLILGAGAGAILGFFSTELGINLEFINIVYLLTPLVLFGALMQVAQGSLMGLERFKEIFYSNFIGNIGRVVLTVLLLYFLFEVSGAIMGFIAWPIITFLIMIFFIYRFLPKRSNRVDKKELMSYGAFAMLSGIMMFVLAQGSFLYLTLLSSIEAVGFFRVAVLFGMIIQLSAKSLLPGLIPSISKFWSEGNYQRVRTLLEMSIKYMLISMLPLTVLILSFPNFIIRTVYRIEYIPAIPYLYSYLIGSILWSAFFLIAYFFYYTDEPKKFLYLASLSAILNTIFAFVLIPMYGGVAASDSFLISQLIALVISFVWMRKKLGVRIEKSMQIAISTIVLISIIYGAKYLFTDIAYLSVLSLLGLLVYFVVLLKLRTFDENDLKFLDTIPDYPAIKYLKRRLKHSIKRKIK